jgi:hypothetical protein
MFVWRRPSKYRLVGIGDSGRSVTLCYVLHPAIELEPLLGRRVIVAGAGYWQRGVRYPVVIPDGIEPAD